MGLWDIIVCDMRDSAHRFPVTSSARMPSSAVNEPIGRYGEPRLLSVNDLC